MNQERGFHSRWCLVYQGKCIPVGNIFSGGEVFSYYLKRVPLLTPLGFLAMADWVGGGGGWVGRRERMENRGEEGHNKWIPVGYTWLCTGSKQDLKCL